MTKAIRTKTEEIEIYAKGLCHCSVCAPSWMMSVGIEVAVNRQYPSGVGRWKVSQDKTFNDGSPMPKVCEDNPDRRHWLLNC